MLNICIQNLGKYNEGELLFKWLELPATEEEIDKALSEIKICHENVDGDYIEFTDEFGQPYEEMHIPDWECDFEGLEYNEWASIRELNEIAEQLDSLSDYERKWLEAYMMDTNESFENAIDDYQDNSRYWDNRSKSDVAMEIADDWLDCLCYGNKAAEEIRQYFDYDQYERDLDIREVGCGVIETW